MDKKDRLIARAKNDGARKTMPYHEASIWVYAARYTHKRNTGAAFQVVNSILLHWEEFDFDTQKDLIKEAHEAKYNLDDWARIIKLGGQNLCS